MISLALSLDSVVVGVTERPSRPLVQFAFSTLSGGSHVEIRRIVDRVLRGGELVARCSGARETRASGHEKHSHVS